MTTIGAIRWDAVFASGGPAQKAVAAAVSPSDYQYRAPAWATEYGPQIIRLEPTQAAMDSEIAAAVAAGLSYWAFLLYDRNSPDPYAAEMMGGYDLFQSSADKGDINWCMIRQGNNWGTTGNYATPVAEAVAQVQQSNYQKVLTNRPLVYVMNAGNSLGGYWGGSYANLKAAIDAFRADVQTAGLGNPYIVAISTSSIANAGADKTGIGADAVSMYAAGNFSGVPQAYSSLRTFVEGIVWPDLAAVGTKIVPIMMSGLDRRPMIRRPMPWEAPTQRPFFGLNKYTTPPTRSQFAAHVEAALSYVSSNPTVCDADTILCYAWNEVTEGTPLCPSIGDPTADFAKAIADALA